MYCRLLTRVGGGEVACLGTRVAAGAHHLALQRARPARNLTPEGPSLARDAWYRAWAGFGRRQAFRAQPAERGGGQDLMSDVAHHAAGEGGARVPRRSQHSALRAPGSARHGARALCGAEARAPPPLVPSGHAASLTPY
jgi:hypothetical protein